MSVNLTQQGIFNASGDVNPNLLKLVPRATSPTAYMACSLNLIDSITAVAGDTYTIQFWDVDVANDAKTVSSLGIAIYWGGGSIQILSCLGSNYFTNGHADYICRTFTITASQASKEDAAHSYLYIYNSPPSVSGSTKSLTIGRWKLERGSVATPWVPSTADDIYVGDTHGFNEQQLLPNAKLYENNILATNFIEW